MEIYGDDDMLHVEIGELEEKVKELEKIRKDLQTAQSTERDLRDLLNMIEGTNNGLREELKALNRQYDKIERMYERKVTDLTELRHEHEELQKEHDRALIKIGKLIFKYQ